MRGMFAALALSAGVSACATVPDIEYTYYPAKATINLELTVTASCSPDNTQIMFAVSGQATPTYMADISQPYSVKLKGMEGAFGSFADTTLGFTFYDDGRLKGVNTTMTGQGEAIIKTAVSLAGGLIGGADQNRGAPAVLPACTAVRTYGGGADKSLALLYKVTLSDPSQFSRATLTVEPQSSAAEAALGQGPGFVTLSARVVAKDEMRVRPAAESSQGDVVQLQLQKMSTAELTVSVNGKPYWLQTITVPQVGANNSYTVPIPKTALFGSQTFTLALGDSGAIESISYGKTTGLTSAITAANDVTQAPTTANAQRAAEIKAQADILAQQTRLANCRANPSKCT